MWNEIVANIKDFFNQPVSIIGCSVGFLLVFVLVIISKTSFGRKALKFLKGKVAKLESEYSEFKDETQNLLENMKAKYEEQVMIAESKVAVLEEVLMIVAENTHNEQVKKAMVQCKEKLSIAQTNYEQLVDAKVKETEEKVVDYEKQLKEKYETELNHYKVEFEQLLNQAQNSVESVQNQAKTQLEELNNEREEIINTISTEETIPED